MSEEKPIKPGRVVELTRRSERKMIVPPLRPADGTLDLNDALRLAVEEGDVVNGSLMAGQSCGLTRDVVPAADLIQRIVTEAEALLLRLSPYVSE